MDQENKQNPKDEEDREKIYLLTLETIFFTNRLIQHNMTNNRINKSLAQSLLEMTSEIERFIENAEIDDEDVKDTRQDVKELIPSIESSILQAHRYYFCKACNQSIKSSSTGINDHIFGKNHKKNLRSFALTFDNEPKQQSQKIDNVNPLKNQQQGGGSLQSLNATSVNATNIVKKERINSLPGRVKDIPIQQENLPRKAREFFSTVNIAELIMELVKEGENVKMTMKHVKVCDLLKAKLSHRFPAVETYPFGSLIHGLGNKYTDLDIFVDTEDSFYGKLSKRKMKDAIFQTQRILSSGAEWEKFDPVVKARTPILRVFCRLENIDCDLSFSNGLSVANTSFIGYILNLQPISKNLIHFVKYWASALNIGVNSYLLTLMVIFYLQQEMIVPPVTLLQENFPPVLIDDWNAAFATLTREHLGVPLITDLRGVLLGFFRYYGYGFDFANYIICVLTGSKVPKHIFNHGYEHLLPPVFKYYAAYMSQININEADEIEDLFANYKPLVIQDPFELIHNVAKGVNEQKLMKMIHYMRCTYDILLNAKF